MHSDDLLWNLISRVAQEDGLKAEKRRKNNILRDLGVRLDQLRITP